MRPKHHLGPNATPGGQFALSGGLPLQTASVATDRVEGVAGRIPASLVPAHWSPAVVLLVGEASRAGAHLPGHPGWHLALLQAGVAVPVQAGSRAAGGRLTGWQGDG